MYCTVCENTGFVNADQIPEEIDNSDTDAVLAFIASTPETNVCVCHCCGDGEGWYGTPGEHYTAADPPGDVGHYASNGGLSRCH